jgi:hypothetical protein
MQSAVSRKDCLVAKNTEKFRLNAAQSVSGWRSEDRRDDARDGSGITHRSAPVRSLSLPSADAPSKYDSYMTRGMRQSLADRHI